jgi:hypothetical protein
MNTTGKNIIGIVLGLAVAMTSFMLFETIAHFAYPMNKNVDVDNAESMQSYMKTVPIGSLSLVLTGWIVGSFLAGYFAKVVSKNNTKRNPIILGIILESATIFNFILLPHPTWFIVVSLLVLIPAVFVGHYFAKSEN